MIYLFTDADGKQTEGIGAIAQNQIHTYTLSKILGVEFVTNKFKRLQHYQEHDTQENFCNDVTEFFNFPNLIDLPEKSTKFEHIDNNFINFINTNINKDDMYVEISDKDLIRFAISNTEKWKDVISDLSERVSFEDSKKYFDDSKLNIGIHIANFIEGRDCDTTQYREYFNLQGDSKEKYYIKIIKKLDNIFNSFDREFHIYSKSQITGDTSHFESFTKLGVPIKFHVDEHPLVSLYHLINSNVRVLSNSSFSYMAALYGDGLNIVRDNYFCRLPYDTIYTDYEGNFDESQITIQKN